MFLVFNNFDYEIKVLQNSQFDLSFLKVITLFLRANVFNNRDSENL